MVLDCLTRCPAQVPYNDGIPKRRVRCTKNQRLCQPGRRVQRSGHREQYDQLRPAHHGNDGEIYDVEPSRLSASVGVNIGLLCRILPLRTFTFFSSRGVRVVLTAEDHSNLHACLTDDHPPVSCCCRAGEHLPLQGPLRCSRDTLHRVLRVLRRLVC